MEIFSVSVSSLSLPLACDWITTAVQCPIIVLQGTWNSICILQNRISCCRRRLCHRSLRHSAKWRILNPQPRLSKMLQAVSAQSLLEMWQCICISQTPVWMNFSSLFTCYYFLTRGASLNAVWNCLHVFFLKALWILLCSSFHTLSLDTWSKLVCWLPNNLCNILRLYTIKHEEYR